MNQALERTTILEGAMKRNDCGALGWRILCLFAALIFLCGSTGCHSRAKNPKDSETSSEKPNEKEAEPEGTVRLSKEVAEQIRFVTVSDGSGVIRERFPGRVEFNKNKTAVVSSPMEGKLLRWLVEPGQTVQRGEVLAQVENPQNLGRPIEIKSPIAGEIVERDGALGGPVTTGDSLFVVNDLDTVWASAEVREDMAGKIIKEFPAEIRVLAFPDEVFSGRIFHESARVESDTRTISFYVEATNPDHKLRAGMFAYVALATGKIDNGLLVPEEALQTVRGKSVVFVRKEPEEFLMTEIRLGRKLGDSYEVLEGLEPGSSVATQGSFVLKSEYLKSEIAEGND
jgi:multidrug efflux pump subunit AcrA (membrane-fusion protein)